MVLALPLTTACAAGSDEALDGRASYIDTGTVDPSVEESGEEIGSDDTGTFETSVIDSGVRDTWTMAIVDTGFADTGATDIVAIDSSVVDSSVVDSSVVDSSVVDSSVVDSSVVDSSRVDSSVADSTVADVGVADTGTVVDVGSSETYVAEVSDVAPPLGCVSSTPLASALAVSPSLSAGYVTALSVGIAGSIAAVGWINTESPGSSTDAFMQLLDLPAVAKHGSTITLASAPLEQGGPIRIGAAGPDFLLAYDRIDYTYGTVRTVLEKIDAAGKRTPFQYDAMTKSPWALISTPAGSAIAYGGTTNVSVRRFTTTGAFADGTSETVISTNGARAGIAYDDASSTYLLLYRRWVSGDPYPTPATARVASSGAPISSDKPVASGAFIANSSPFRLVKTSGGYSAVLDRNDASGKSLGVYLLSLHADGTADGEPKPLIATGHEAAFAWNGAFFGMIWEDARDSAGGSIYFAAFDTNGKRLGEEVQLSPPINHGRYVDIAWDGKAFVVVWMDQRETIGRQRVYGTRICSSS